MQVIIMGEDRAEFCTVAKKNKEKHFIKIRNSQLYKVYPNGLCRMKIDWFGEEIRSDEVIVYAENETIPYIVKIGVRYGMEPMLMAIDEHKRMTEGAWFRKKQPWFSSGSGGFLLNLLKNPAFWIVIIGVIFTGPMLLRGFFGVGA